jgi:hypothetical protein
MTIDLSPLDAKIRKFQKLKELLSDAETRELLADPEVRLFIQQTVRSNGSSRIVAEEPESTRPKPQKKLRPGTLLANILEATTDLKAHFTVKDVVEAYNAKGFSFEAKNPEVATLSTLNKLAKHKFIRVWKKGKGRRATIFTQAKPEASG